MTGSRRLASLFVLGIGAFALFQIVPYGRDHSAPPDGMHVAWSSPQAEQIAKRACYDCHSNQTRWPWYASIAPMSWRIQSHVQEGREALDFTAFQPGQEEMTEAAGEAGEKVSKGEMPPADYLLLHPEARLSAAERDALIKGLDQTFAAYGEREGDGEGNRTGAELASREGRQGHEREEARDDEDRDEKGEKEDGDD